MLSARSSPDDAGRLPPGRPVALEVPQRIDRVAVDSHLEVEVRPGGVAGGADVADYLALGDLLAAADGDARLVAVCRRDPAAVVDHREVAVALHPAAVDDDAGRGRMDGRSGRRAEVDALVDRAPAGAE